MKDSNLLPKSNNGNTCKKHMHVIKTLLHCTPISQDFVVLKILLLEECTKGYVEMEIQNAWWLKEKAEYKITRMQNAKDELNTRWFEMREGLYFYSCPQGEIMHREKYGVMED